MKIKIFTYILSVLFISTIQAKRCGPNYGSCPVGQCCSAKGYCGKTAAYCSSAKKCQPEYGDCKCGKDFGSCNDGLCCSKKGYCGKTDAHCLITDGCQSEFGNCRCGPGYGNCPAGQCCSKDGFCGKTDDYCSATKGCQISYGDCRCGNEFGKCPTGQCCSAKGYCGKTAAYCYSSKKCQPEFGNCRCGKSYGSCSDGQCCSKKGYCGKTKDFCLITDGCQSEFGNCRCGPGYGNCPAAQCCSKDGFCGKTNEFCSASNGCQSEFGDCRCGDEFGKCPTGQCCSKKGYCGKADAYCANDMGCQSEFGECQHIEEENNSPSINYIPDVMEESYDEIDNPYRGWYHGSYTVDLTENAYNDCNFIYVFGKVRRHKSGLQYLGVRLSEFYDKKISPEALVILDNLLNEYKKRKEEIDPTTQLILRFYYNSGEEHEEPTKIAPLNSPLKAPSAKLEEIEEESFVKKEIDDGELYVTEDDINYMKKVFNPNINSNIKIDMKNIENNNSTEITKRNKLSKRESGEFVLVEENNCYKYIPTDYEPDSVETILEHVDQLSQIVNKYKDIVYIYQGVFVGKWGEMHSTPHATSLSSCTDIMKTLNEKLDSSIYLAVRTPCHYRALTNEIRKISEQGYGTLIKRLSLFNDGLFRTELDTGTYGASGVTCFDDDVDKLYEKKPRKDEVEFQNELCLKVPNGGEVLSNSHDDEYEEIYELEDIEEAIANPDNYNNFYVCENHSKNIHLSYINDKYDRNLFERWDNTFSKQIYKPEWSDVSGEEYMGRHLGYRYVLRDSSFTDNTTLNIIVENIGFSPAYKLFYCEVSFESSEDTFVKTIDSDNRDWPLNTNITLAINLENEFPTMANTTYDIYFNLYDLAIDYDIRFANTNEYHESYGYKIGQLALGEESETITIVTDNNN